MTNKLIPWPVPFLAAIGTLMLLLLACGGEGDAGGSNPTGVAVVVSSSGPTATQPPSRTASPTPTPSPSPSPLDICSPNPDPATPAVLQVETPEAEAKTTIPVHVRGWSSNIGEEDKVVFVAVVDQKQDVLQTNEVPPQPREFRVPPAGLEITEFTRPFAIDILIDDVIRETPYCIWVYQDVDEEGKARGVVQVPIVVEPR
ncbi:MAG: hypothetical protein IIA90_00180 [Chloroflexi bacterium]|nr:hypothetical protein [Chloroflexota bacterium]